MIVMVVVIDACCEFVLYVMNRDGVVCADVCSVCIGSVWCMGKIHLLIKKFKNIYILLPYIFNFVTIKIYQIMIIIFNIDIAK